MSELSENEQELRRRNINIGDFEQSREEELNFLENAKDSERKQSSDNNDNEPMDSDDVRITEFYKGQ